MMGTILESSEEKINIPIIKVNSDVHNELSIKMGVMSIPTLILMENGKEIKRHVGVMNESELLEFIKWHSSFFFDIKNIINYNNV